MQQLPVQQLKQWLDETGNAPLIIDVREPWEHGICRIEPSTLIPMGQIPARLEELDQEKEIIVLCHHGIRSMQVCRFLAHHGFTNLYNVYGGIEAWAREVDPFMEQY